MNLQLGTVWVSPENTMFRAVSWCRKTNATWFLCVWNLTELNLGDQREQCLTGELGIRGGGVLVEGYQS